MKRTKTITCPNCGGPLRHARGMRIGKKIRCDRCAIAFTVRPEDVEEGGAVNPARLAIVLAFALIYLLGGAAIAAYCFTHNRAENEAPRADTLRTDRADDDDDSDDLGAPPEIPAPPLLGSLSAADQRKIDLAVASGVRYLRHQARLAGGWVNDSVGFAALPGLTLLECGVPGSDPLIQKAAALVRLHVINIGGDAHGTYQLALAILFLDRLGAYQDDDLIRYLALCLIAGQHPSVGGWHYQCPMLDRAMVPQLLRILADDKRTLPDWRGTALRGATFDPRGWDNSNTQFAILALWVARRHRVPIDKCIAIVESHFRATQLSGPLADPDGNNVDLDGSWYYDTANARGWRNSSRWPSMTCSGLLGLAVGHGVTKNPFEKKQKPLDDPAIQRGLAMLAREIDRRGERRPPDLYYLWSLQRVGVIFKLNSIDGKDWYVWGFHILLPRQRNDGSWHDGGYFGSHPVLDTCFALLFLKRANLAKDLTDKLQLLSVRK